MTCRMILSHCQELWPVSVFTFDARQWHVSEQFLENISHQSSLQALSAFSRRKNECSFSVKIVIAKSDNYTMVFFVRGWLIASWIKEVRLHWSAVTGTYSQCSMTSFNYISLTKCKKTADYSISFFLQFPQKEATLGVPLSNLCWIQPFFFLFINPSCS